MDGERSMETHTLPYVKQVASGNLLHDAGSSHWSSATTQKGGSLILASWATRHLPAHLPPSGAWLCPAPSHHHPPMGIQFCRGCLWHVPLSSLAVKKLSPSLLGWRKEIKRKRKWEWETSKLQRERHIRHLGSTASFFLALLEEQAKPRSALGSQYFTQRRHKRMVEVHADKWRVPWKHLPGHDNPLHRNF